MTSAVISVVATEAAVQLCDCIGGGAQYIRFHLARPRSDLFRRHFVLIEAYESLEMIEWPRLFESRDDQIVRHTPRER